MDGKTFDRWTGSVTRLLTEAGSRRRALVLGASGLAGLWHLGNTDETAAKRKHKKHKKRKKNNQSPPPPATDTCLNSVKDGSETDVDCGGGTCVRCAVGKVCSTRNDCASAVCTNGACGVCVNNTDCGLDSDGNICACRDHESGARFCTKLNSNRPAYPAGTPCSVCTGGEQCLLINGGANGIECILPCGA
jgi:hypothetical protein